MSKLTLVFVRVLLMTRDFHDTSMSRVAANTRMCFVAACDCLHTNSYVYAMQPC